MKNTALIVAATIAAVASADVTGEFNSWLGYMAGYEASGNRATFMGAGAGGGATYIYRTDYFGAAAGTYSLDVHDSVGIGYRALRYSYNVSNVVAIGSHAFEGINMGGLRDATWLNGHFVANPTHYDAGSGSFVQDIGTFYLTADATQTNALAPIWYDGTNLHLRGYSPGGGGGGGGAVNLLELMANAGIDYVDDRGDVFTAELRVKLWNQYSQIDSSQEDEITYFTETTFGGLRAWTNATSTAIFLATSNRVYYASDKGQLNESNPLSGLDALYQGHVRHGAEFSMFTPNVTSFEYVRYVKKDEIVYKSQLRQVLTELGVTVSGDN